MKIDVLFFEGCPNHSPAVELVESVVSELDVSAVINQVPVSDGADAERLRFFGSPSVQVDGVDIDPTTEGRTDFAFSCRIYEESGLPTRQMLINAIQNHSPQMEPQT